MTIFAKLKAWWNRPPAMHRLLSALSDTEWRHGLAVYREARVSVSYFYVTVFRLEDQGIIESKWEEGPIPRRRLYRLTQGEKS